MILQEGSFTIMDLTKAVKEKYKKPLTSCTNKEIYICLLEQVKKLAKEKEAASEKTAATTGRRKLLLYLRRVSGRQAALQQPHHLGLTMKIKK